MIAFVEGGAARLRHNAAAPWLCESPLPCARHQLLSYRPAIISAPSRGTAGPPWSATMRRVRTRIVGYEDLEKLSARRIAQITVPNSMPCLDTSCIALGVARRCRATALERLCGRGSVRTEQLLGDTPKVVVPQITTRSGQSSGVGKGV